MPKYVLCKYYRGGPKSAHDTPPLEEWSPEDLKAHTDFLYDVQKELRERGEYLDLVALLPERTWLRSDGIDGEPIISDGPPPEACDLIAGWYTVEVASYERAVEIAAQISAGYGPGGEPEDEWIDIREAMPIPERE